MDLGLEEVNITEIKSEPSSPNLMPLSGTHLENNRSNSAGSIQTTSIEQHTVALASTISLRNIYKNRIRDISGSVSNQNIMNTTDHKLKSIIRNAIHFEEFMAHVCSLPKMI